jgi:Peptidase family S41
MPSLQSKENPVLTPIFLKALAAAGAALVLSVAPTSASAQPEISADALRADLRLAVETIVAQHPDLAHSVSRDALAKSATDIESQLNKPMNQAQAWAVLAQLNPVLADGHLFIGLPDWRSESNKALETGAAFFPFEVTLSETGDVRILATLGGGPTPLAGARVKRINGLDAASITKELLHRTHGDSPAFRAALLSQRWWLFYQKLYGSPANFELVVEGAPKRRYRVAASNARPVILEQDADFDRQFACEMLPKRRALLTINSFYWPDNQRYFDFTRQCFLRMKELSVDRLVIDIRANGGGDDDMWKAGILHYIADRPYKHAAEAIKRVHVTDPAKGEVAGQIVSGIIPSDTPAAIDEPLKFDGQVYVLAGPNTYSSAVLFSNVVQDYKFAALAGTGGAVRARQSGGTRSITLPATGLVLVYPRFVLTRPSGGSEPHWVSPEILVADDPLHPRAAVDALLAR